MKRAFPGLVALLLTLVQVSAMPQIAAVPQMMNFQGRLAKPDGTPVPDGTYSIRFSLWTAATGGTEKWNQTSSPVTVRNGVFAVLLNTGTGAADKFNNNLFLEVKVGNDPALTPRQPLGSVAYAFKADSIKDGGVTGASIANATITADKFASDAFNPLAWLLNGNSGVTNGFIGTTDNNPFTLKVNNRRAMQYTYVEDTSDPDNALRSINVLGGSDINSIAPGVMGATLVGGGEDYFTGSDNPNTVTGYFGTLVGGSLNTAGGFSFVGGGYNNKATEFFSTIAGGTYNTASNNQTFIGGGILNTASGFGATVPGGENNAATGKFSFASGQDNAATGDYSFATGLNNRADGYGATVAGGFHNSAAGQFSFAAGRQAKAYYAGDFVWGDDSTDADFVATDANQFLIRATGGIKLHPNTTIEFGFGVPGKESNAGRIGYATFTPGALDIVGGGTPGARKVKIWAEGGATFSGNVIASGYSTTSDARYKKHIATVDNALETIENLRGVTFDWDREQWKDRQFEEGRQVGFIAQEVEKVLPELVHTDANGYKSVAYANVVPVLVEAVKTLKKDNEGKDKKLAEMEARLDLLAAAIAKLKANNK